MRIESLLATVSKFEMNSYLLLISSLLSLFLLAILSTMSYTIISAE